MRERIAYCLICIVVFFEGCSVVTEKSEGVVTELKKPLEEFQISLLSDSVVSLKFELPEPHIWGIVTDVFFVDSTVFMVDKKQGNIFRFNKNGTFINKIGSRGEGPGEFRKLTDVLVDENYVYAGNISERKLYCYTHEGIFIRTIAFAFELIYDDIIPLSSGRFLCHDIIGYKGENKIWIMNDEGQVDTTLLVHDAVYPYSHSSFNTINYTDTRGVYKILDPITGCIYVYDENSNELNFQKRFVSDFNGLDKFLGNDLLAQVHEEYAYLALFREMDNHTYLVWNTSESVGYHGIYSEMTNTVQAYKKIDMDLSGVPCFTLPVSTNLSAMVTVLTNEFDCECFPEEFRENLSEKTLVVNIFL